MKVCALFLIFITSILSNIFILNYYSTQNALENYNYLYKDYQNNIEYSNNHKWIFDRLNEFFSYNTGIEVIANLDSIHLFNYGPGNKFVKHRDIYHENQVYNIGASLNSDFEGGEFKLYKPDIILPKETGNVYTFACTREHEVLEVTKGNRWSIIGFYHYKHLNMKRSLV